MSKKVEESLEKTSFFLLCLILFDCAALGGGTIIELFGIGIRMVLYGLFFLASLPSVLKNFKGLMANGYFLLLLAWIVWQIISTIRGIDAGNSISSIVASWIGFASFGLLPGTICVLNSQGRVRNLMKVLTAAAFFLALQSIAVLLVYNLCDLEVFMDLNLYMIREELGGCTGVNDMVVRVFFRSHPLMVAGCVCSLFFSMVEEKKWLRLMHCGSIALCLFSLLISYTRSIYLCAFVAVAVVIVAVSVATKKNMVRRMGKSVLTVLASFLVLLAVCDVLAGTEYLCYGIYRTVGVDVLNKVEVRLGMPDGHLGGGYDLDLDTEPAESSVTDESTETETTVPSKTNAIAVEEYDHSVNVNIWSDNIRVATVQELYARIGEHPIIGSGMGASLEVRAGLDGNNEYFYLDQAFKTGIVGITLYMAPMILMLILFLTNMREMEQENVLICAMWLAGFAGIAAFSALNPYLNGSNGIVLYCCTIGVFSALNKKKQILLKCKLK